MSHEAGNHHTLSLTSSSPEETDALGARLGALLRPGDALLLQGPLGAGKTALTRGIARGAGSPDLVNSPTFVLVNEYEGPVKLYHADLYRLESPDDVLALELDNYARDGALIVEWPERGDGALPEERLLVRIEHAGGDRRAIAISAAGARAAELLVALQPAASRPRG